MEIIIVVLALALLLEGCVSYLVYLEFRNRQEEERDRFNKAMELAHVRYQEQINKATQDARALGMNEGKRDNLEWIKEQVDSGAMTVRVHDQS